MTGPATSPISVSLERLKCYEQEDGEPPIFDTEDDEPYVLVLSIDNNGRQLVPGLPVRMPSTQLFQVGPIEGFDQGDLKPAPDNTLWGLGGRSAPMPDINRTAFLVTLLENDNADPVKVGKQARAQLQASAFGLWSNALGRADLDEQQRYEFFLTTVRDAFEAIVDVARSTAPIDAALDPDDRIGPVQVMRFSAEEQRQVLAEAHTTIERTLYFEGDDASYDLDLLPAPAAGVALASAVPGRTARRGPTRCHHRRQPQPRTTRRLLDRTRRRNRLHLVGPGLERPRRAGPEPRPPCP